MLIARSWTASPPPQGDLEYLDLADYLLIAEAVTGIHAEILTDVPRVVDLASSALAVPSSGWQGCGRYPELAQKAGLLTARLAKNHPLAVTSQPRGCRWSNS